MIVPYGKQQDRSDAHRLHDEMVEALWAVAKQGVKREDACDKVRPPNLCAFFNNLPRPERDRLLGLAYQEQMRR